MKFLNETDIRKKLKCTIDDPKFNDWFNIVKKILLNQEFQKRRLFKHHTKSVWDHCIEVSFKSYKCALKFNADARVCAIAGMLHDFYPYAWQYSEELENYDKRYLDRLNRKEPFFKNHGFTHAREAYENYLKYFKELDDKRISNCILRHMYPLNIIPPKYKEAWIVTLIDKKVSIKDTNYIIKAILNKGKDIS